MLTGDFKPPQPKPPDLEDIPAIDLGAIDIPSDVIGLLPRALAHEHGVVPINRIAGAMVVALADPTDVRALEKVREATGLAVLPAVATPHAVSAALWRYYRGLALCP